MGYLNSYYGASLTIVLRKRFTLGPIVLLIRRNNETLVIEWHRFWGLLNSYKPGVLFYATWANRITSDVDNNDRKLEAIGVIKSNTHPEMNITDYDRY